LRQWQAAGQIVWLRLAKPSITHAMNQALLQATGAVVLFVDDDIRPAPRLVAAHRAAYQNLEVKIVAGQIIQPWQQPLPPRFPPPGDYVIDSADDPDKFTFNSGDPGWIRRFGGGNISLRRDFALRLGGFDENFVQVAYRFEAEFASRVLALGERIWFEPAASLHHLKAERGGTRQFGNYLATARPAHTVGKYYYWLQARGLSGRTGKILAAPWRAIATRHHLRRPWWIPVSLWAEFAGLAWALWLWAQGPRLLCERL
jgi:GT2 family glycosyltransferase